MTRSSRRKDTAVGHLHDLAVTKEKCEECRGRMVQTGKDTYVCLDCGLEQKREPKSDPE